MEEWIDLFSSIISENPEVSAQACNSIDQMISEFDLNLFNAATIVLMNEPIQYNTRHAAGIILGRALNKKNGQVINKDIEKFWIKEENSQMISTLKDAVLKIINEDTDLLQNDCSWIIALIFQIEKSNFLPFISEILLKFDSLKSLLISSTLLNNIFNLPFYKSRIKSAGFTELLGKVYPTYVDLLGKPVTELDSDELRILISETILKGLSLETDVFNSEESITSILNALPQSFPIPNLKLYQNLNSILSSLVIHFYDLSHNFVDAVFEYTSKGLSCEDEDFIISSLQVWNEILNYEITLYERHKKVLGVANKFFLEFLNIFMNFGERGAASISDAIFQESYNLLYNAFLIVKISNNFFQNYFQIISSVIQDCFNDQSNLLALFLGMYLVTVITSDSVSKIHAISDFVYSEVTNIVFDLFFNSTDQQIVAVAAWTMGKIFEGTVIPNHNRHEDFGNITDITNLVLNRIEDQFKPDRSKYFLMHLSNLFLKLVNNFKLKSVIFSDLGWEHFFTVYFSILQLWPEIEVESSFAFMNFSRGINNLLGLTKDIRDIWPKVLNSLIEMLVSTFNSIDEKITTVQGCYLENISYILEHGIRLVPETSTILINILKYLFTMRISTTYEISLDILTSLVIINNYNEELAKLYLEYMTDGMESNDPNVIMQCASTATRFFTKMGPFRINYIEDFKQCLDCFLKSLSLVDPSFTNVAVAYVIRAVADIIAAAYEENKINIESFIEYAYEPFNNIITDYVCVDIDPESMEDLNQFYQEISQAIFHAMAVFTRIYLSKMTVPLQKSFLQKVFKVFIKKVGLIEPLSMESIRNILGSIHEMHKYLSKKINGYCGHIYVQNIIVKYKNYPDHIYREQIELMWMDIYGSLDCFNHNNN
ncbi:hypothetical protein TVAG_490350 [Trichomonas vaginalis G3]|uniref:Importin N-terminal domain-containing protein n=1 Tax=Trichomonas vaginalis (strain ATCC PRA-98 / G3) TaxID=412133 RepID=A2F0X2_TRIV3|nr:armadillo (ARM) repeat-containing protein family [Trichomonas vaginalis G3]EAY01447.1 hypothetical protein TVAG_490350 [Trichomonas vaginalis G3]KAI5519260.1 armadillo (ARM) repeat-containing protein family [Trichomonas vaginalis G3]|eukprot:XP_001314151.1 hypothetical protein [Trichomonas vaginalis G3]